VSSKYCGIALIILFTIPSECLYSQTYQIHKQKDIILGTSILGLGVLDYKFYQNLEPLTIEEINNLEAEKIWIRDRFASKFRSITADRISDYTHYATFGLPLILLSTTQSRKELSAIGIMLVEAIGLNAALTIMTKTLVLRERPFTYNPGVRLEDKQSRSARLSFVSGHASNASTLGIFTAKVFSDLHPESKWKPLVWVVGAGLPALVATFRVTAGKHFMTDVVAGYTLGGLIGYFIPVLHKKSSTSRITMGIGRHGLIGINIQLDR